MLRLIHYLDSVHCAAIPSGKRFHHHV